MSEWLTRPVQVALEELGMSWIVMRVLLSFRERKEFECPGLWEMKTRSKLDVG